MKALNTDDIFLRNLTIALLDLLNETMYVSLTRDDTSTNYAIPFLYNYGTDEGFLKDFYVGLPDNCKIPVAEGTYDIVPRGIVTLINFQVKDNDITNRFIRGQHTEMEKNDKGENVLSGYSAQMYSIPLSVKFDIKVICDSLNKAFKIGEKFLDLLYSNRVMYFQYNGVRVPSQFHFSESESIDKKYSFTYSDSNYMNVAISVDVETYFPSFESTSRRRASNVMERIEMNVVGTDEVNLSKEWIDQNTRVFGTSGSSGTTGVY